MKFWPPLVAAFVACSGPADPPPDAGPVEQADAALPPMTCDEHPELAQIESIACSVNADCPVTTVCAPLVCGPAGACVFGPLVADGVACELGGTCDDRRCCHGGAVVP